jgi:hypothetical protein
MRHCNVGEAARPSRINSDATKPQACAALRTADRRACSITSIAGRLPMAEFELTDRGDDHWGGIKNKAFAAVAQRRSDPAVGDRKEHPANRPSPAEKASPLTLKASLANQTTSGTRVHGQLVTWPVIVLAWRAGWRHAI